MFPIFFSIYPKGLLNLTLMADGRPIGTNTAPIRYPTEGTNSYGRESQIVKSEAPTRVDWVNDNLIYNGWADAGAACRP